MIKEETKETHSVGSGWFAIEDINRRAEAAMDRHPDVFGSFAHQTAVAAVVDCVKDYFASYGAVYETARPATKRRPAHTEVKVQRYVLKSRRDSTAFRKSIESAGGKEMNWKHNTESLSIHVW
jgi:hypothetical protein